MEILELLSHHQHTANFEELRLRYHNCELQEVAVGHMARIFINACRNLKILRFELSCFTRGEIEALVEAIAKSGKTLGVLSLKFFSLAGQIVYFPEEPMSRLESFERLRELRVLLALSKFCNVSLSLSLLLLGFPTRMIPSGVVDCCCDTKGIHVT